MKTWSSWAMSRSLSCSAQAHVSTGQGRSDRRNVQLRGTSHAPRHGAHAPARPGPYLAGASALVLSHDSADILVIALARPEHPIADTEGCVPPQP